MRRALITLLGTLACAAPVKAAAPGSTPIGLGTGATTGDPALVPVGTDRALVAFDTEQADLTATTGSRYVSVSPAGVSLTRTLPAPLASAPVPFGRASTLFVLGSGPEARADAPVFADLRTAVARAGRIGGPVRALGARDARSVVAAAAVGTRAVAWLRQDRLEVAVRVGAHRFAAPVSLRPRAFFGPPSIAALPGARVLLAVRDGRQVVVLERSSRTGRFARHVVATAPRAPLDVALHADPSGDLAVQWREGDDLAVAVPGDLRAALRRRSHRRFGPSVVLARAAQAVAARAAALQDDGTLVTAVTHSTPGRESSISATVLTLAPGRPLRSEPLAADAIVGAVVARRDGGVLVAWTRLPPFRGDGGFKDIPPTQAMASVRPRGGAFGPSELIGDGDSVVAAAGAGPTFVLLASPGRDLRVARRP